MTEQEKLDLVTNYFADDWSIDKAISLLEDYEKMLEAQQTSPHAPGRQPAPVETTCWACNGTGLVTTSSNGSGLIGEKCQACSAARKQGGSHD